MLPIEQEARQRSLAARKRLAGESGGQSDHLALIQVGSLTHNYHSSMSMKLIAAARTHLIGASKALLLTTCGLA